MEDKRKELVLKLRENNICEGGINDFPDSSVHKLYNLYLKHEFEEPETAVEMVFVGKYYGYMDGQINYKLAKKYYLMAIELGNSDGMNNLAIQYKCIEKNYDLCKKYYFMAIELGNEKAMNNLAIYYDEVEKDLKLAKKYYLMAIKFGNKNAPRNLGLCYSEKGKNEKALKFYMIQPEKSIHEIIELLKSKDTTLPFIAKHKRLKTVVKSQKRTIQEQQLQIEHLKFKPGGPEFEKAKSHFFTLASQ